MCFMSVSVTVKSEREATTREDPDTTRFDLARHDPDPVVRRRAGVISLVAALAVLSFAVRSTFPVGISVQFLVAALLLPAWFPVLRRYRGMSLLFGLGVLAIGSGIWLHVANAGDHPVDPTETATEVVLLLGILFTIGLLLWARTVLGLAVTALLFGAAMIPTVYPFSEAFLTNPWKFGFVVPVAVIALALSHRWNLWYVDAAVLVGLALYSVSHDSRSAFGEFLLALVVVLVQVPLRRSQRPGSIARVIVAVAALAIVVYQAGQALILNGFLGAATQERSIAQLDASGNLLLGGRPEFAATLALLQNRPGGFGAGVAVTPTELEIAKTGMAGIGYNPDNGYVYRYMFGGHVELHSVAGDLWARFGLVGLVFTLALLIFLVIGVAHAIAQRKATGLIVFPVILCLWNLLFGPLLSSAAILELAVVVVAFPLATASSRSRGATWGMMKRRARELPTR